MRLKTSRICQPQPTKDSLVSDSYASMPGELVEVPVIMQDGDPSIQSYRSNEAVDQLADC